MGTIKDKVAHLLGKWATKLDPSMIFIPHWATYYNSEEEFAKAMKDEAIQAQEYEDSHCDDCGAYIPECMCDPQCGACGEIGEACKCEDLQEPDYDWMAEVENGR